METFTMNRKERKRLELFSRVKRQEVSLLKAAELLGLSYRQAKRSYGRYRELGDAGLGASAARPALEPRPGRAA